MMGFMALTPDNTYGKGNRQMRVSFGIFILALATIIIGLWFGGPPLLVGVIAGLFLILR